MKGEREEFSVLALPLLWKSEVSSKKKKLNQKILADM